MHAGTEEVQRPNTTATGTGPLQIYPIVTAPTLQPNLNPKMTQSGPGTDVVVAVKVPGIEPSEMKALMEKNASWPYDAPQDGWYRAHEAIRLDMKDISAALAAVVQRLGEGKQLAGWEAKNIQTVWPKFAKMVHHHHDNEEKVAFPWLAARATLPPKMSADHETLLQEMTDVGNLIKALRAGTLEENLKAWTELRNAFDAMKVNMQEHLQEEDEIGLPQMRKLYTYKEFQPIEKKIVAGMTPEDMGWFLRPFGNDPARRKWMTEIAQIPGFVQSLILLPGLRKWENNTIRLIEELKAGQQITPQPTGCFAC